MGSYIVILLSLWGLDPTLRCIWYQNALEYAIFGFQHFRTPAFRTLSVSNSDPNPDLNPNSIP